jgi:hypothetical protein
MEQARRDTSAGEAYLSGAVGGAFIGVILNKWVSNSFNAKASMKIIDANDRMLFNQENLKVDKVWDYPNINVDELADYAHQFLAQSFPDWIKLRNLAKKYTINLPYGEAMSERDAKLSQLGRKKEEFESTSEYNDRLKHEELQKMEIQAVYNQKKTMLDEQGKTHKLKIKREMESLINEIEFTSTLDFEISNYNADKQIYVFTIPKIKENRELSVAKSEAKAFKDNIGSYKIKQYVKASLDGKWIPKYDDLILVYTQTNDILPWAGGEVPTFATTSITDPPELSVVIKLIEPSGEGFLDANENVTLSVTLENNGSGPSGTTRASLIQKSGPTLIYDVTINFSKIEPNKQTTKEFSITVPDNMSNSNVGFTVEFLESNGFEPEPVSFTAETRSERAPLFVLVGFGVEDNDGDGRVAKGEIATITARIQNQGQGIGKEVKVSVKDNPTKNIYLTQWSEREFELGDIIPNEHIDIEFSIQTNNRVGNVVEIDLMIDDSRPKYSKTETIKLEIDKPQTTLKQFVFTGEKGEIDIEDVGELSIDIEKNIPKTDMVNKDAIAVVIGNREYESGIPMVEFAVRDAEFVKEYLIQTLGYREGNIIHYKNATLSNIKVAFNKLNNLVKKGKSDVFVYYSGHGAPDPETNQGYFVPVDADPNYIKESGFPVNDLYSLLNDMNAKSLTVVIDACFSGSSDAGMILKDISPVFIEVDQSSLTGKNATLFTSATGEQVSSWYREKKHSLFTYYFLKALQGEGDINKDDKLTFAEIQSYIDEKVPYMARRLNNREQTPQLDTMDKNRVLVQY